MSRKATEIVATPEVEQTLRRWVRAGSTPRQLVERAQMILWAAQGRSTDEIARTLGTRSARVSKWRTRFARLGLAGLTDASRSGRPPQYGPETEHRILKRLDQPPPEGQATWTGELLAEALGNVSKHQVWRVLKERGLSLRRRRSWCLSTDPEFTRKAADIVGLYLNPPENAVVLCVDEKPHIQAIQRAQGWLVFSDRPALRGFNSRYKRNGTTTLFAALEVAAGLVKTGHYSRRRRREFLDFMNEIIADYPEREVHVILDNLRTHKPKEDRWLRQHPRVRLHYTPTHASWLNEIEMWFSILQRRALQGASFTSPQELRGAIDRFTRVYNRTAKPFVWRKREVHPKGFKPYNA